MNKEIKYAVMSINTLNGYGLSIFDTFEEANADALKWLSEKFSKVEVHDEGWHLALGSYPADEYMYDHIRFLEAYGIEKSVSPKGKIIRSNNIKYAVMNLKSYEGYMLSEFDTFEEANKEALKCLSEEYSKVEKQDYRNGWRFAVESYVFDEDGNATEYLETHREYDVCEYYDKMRIKGRVYEIRKSSANIKDIANISEGCVFDQQGYKTEILKKFSELEDAEMALRKYESTAKWINPTAGWEVSEYYIEENWYDEDGDWFDGDFVWKFARNNFDIVDIRYELKSSEASLSVEKIHKFTDGIALVEGARTEVLKTFDSESEALEELKSLKNGGTFYGSLFYVKEYYVEKLVYEPSGEFICSEGICGYAANNFDGAAEAFEEAQKIRAFLSDESNIGNCDECAYNEGYDRRYPCGQFRCSVEVHCAAAAECEDDEK